MKRSFPAKTIVLVAILGLTANWPGQASANLVLSLDASNPDLLTLDGSNVTAWEQEFGLHQSLSFTLDPEGLATEAPTYNPTGLNGKGTVDFSKGENDFMLFPEASNLIGGKLLGGDPSEYTIFFVADAMDGNGTAFSQQAFGSGGSMSFRNGANWSYRIGGSTGGPTANGFFDSGDPTSSGFKVRSVVSDATSLTWDIGGSTTVIADTNHAIRQAGAFTLGNRFAPFNHPANVSIAQMAIFDTTLDLDTRTGIHSILADKWGLPAVTASAKQIALGMTALTKPVFPPPPPIAHYHFTNGSTSGSIDSVDSSDGEPNSIAGEWFTGGAELISTCCGNPDRGAFFGDQDGNADTKEWVSIGEIGPGIPSTVSSFAPPPSQTPTVDRDFFGFTVLPDEGFELDLEAVTFDLQRDTIDGLDSWALYADEDPGSGGDNFSTKLGGATGEDVPTGAVRDYNNFQIDISEIDFLQNVTDATTFRLYFWHDGEFSNDVWLADAEAQAGGTELNRTNTRLDNVLLVGLVSEMTDLPGDFDKDGDIDGDDFLIWQQNFNGAGPFTANEGDADGDGDVDGDDFLIWQAGFGTSNSAGSATIPEPATLLSLVLAATALVARRRRIG